MRACARVRACVCVHVCVCACVRVQDAEEREARKRYWMPDRKCRACYKCQVLTQYTRYSCSTHAPRRSVQGGNEH